MGRWEPDARGRLEQAALDLFTEQGFAATTVPQITERAGLTTRTFFRYFADKREVLFADEATMREQFAAAITRAPDDLTSMQLIEFALDQLAAEVFEPRFDLLRRWRSVVAADEGLRERALRKEELTMRSAVAALRERGLDAEESELVAHLSSVVLHAAVTRWLAQSSREIPLVDWIHEGFDRLRTTVK